MPACLASVRFVASILRVLFTNFRFLLLGGDDEAGMDGEKGLNHTKEWTITVGVGSLHLLSIVGTIRRYLHYILCLHGLARSPPLQYHNLGLGTNYVFLHVGWVQNLNLFLVVFLLVSTRATWDSGTKY